MPKSNSDEQWLGTRDLSWRYSHRTGIVGGATVVCEIVPKHDQFRVIVAGEGSDETEALQNAVAQAKQIGLGTQPVNTGDALAQLAEANERIRLLEAGASPDAAARDARVKAQASQRGGGSGVGEPDQAAASNDFPGLTDAELRQALVGRDLPVPSRDQSAPAWREEACATLRGHEAAISA